MILDAPLRLHCVEGASGSRLLASAHPCLAVSDGARPAHPVQDDDTVGSYGDPIDPSTEEGCEDLCGALSFSFSFISDIHSCSVSMPADDETNDGPSETTDTEVSDRMVTVTCVTTGEEFCVGGRHTNRLATRARGQGVDATATWLAREASGEAGSVNAFRQLARELRMHGAPAPLVAAAEAAMFDEVRHARMVGDLARSRGGRPSPVRTTQHPPRDLFTIALENAVEGCVHETFAAARAGYQAMYAQDSHVRAVCGELVEDESRHADLAASVHDWACSRLSTHQAEAIEAARRNAWTRLALHPPAIDPGTMRTLGLPGARVHTLLAFRLADALLAHAA